MPFTSKRQSRLFHWAEEHPAEAARRGLKPAAVKKFLADTKGQKVGNLPETAPTPEHKAHGGRAFTAPAKPTGW